MPGRAKSESKKRQIASETKAHYVDQAVEDYKKQLEQKSSGKEFLGARSVAKKWVECCRKETKLEIRINHQTLINRATGKTSGVKNASKSWLTPEEAELVIGFIIEVGHRGFPLSHRHLKEHVDQILRGRLGSDFPGVGKRWTNRFVEKWSDRIQMAWSTSLEQKRGRAVNPTTNDAWFDLLERTKAEFDIVEETTYGTDEFGCNGSVGQKERVMGSKGQKVHYQQIGGSRENITVIETICADGTCIPPTVIFKGSAHMVGWKQNNPANAMFVCFFFEFQFSNFLFRLGYSKKGWTNGEIGVEWIKNFDNSTKAKANGRYRLLLVDGHNSHYTYDFLQYAREHKIVVLCYPSHTTHVYQGLDVAVFGALKNAIRQERDAYERSTGQKFSKKNFLEIYGPAHLRIMTEATIKSAFRVTGVWPPNRAVITSDMLAPAKETSSESGLPLIPSTPVRAVAQILRNAIKLEIQEDLLEDDHDSDSDISVGGGEDNPFLDLSTIAEEHRHISDVLSSTSGDFTSPFVSRHPSPPPSEHLALPLPSAPLDEIQDAVKRLAESSLECLVRTYRTSPTDSTTQPINVNPPSHLTSIPIAPQNDREQLLFTIIQEVELENKLLRRQVMELQAANILNEAYCKTLWEQLAFKDKGKEKKESGGRLMGDGLPVLLTDDFFMQRVVVVHAIGRERCE